MTPSSYRPAADTSAAIRTAIALAQRDAAAVETAMHVAKRERDALLLDGSGAALARAESALAETRGDCERLDAIRLELDARLAAAIRAEAFAKVADAERELSTANAQLNAFWRTEGAALAGLLARALAAWQPGTSARVALRSAQLRAMTEYFDEADRVAAGLTPIEPLDDATGPLLTMLAHSPLIADVAATATAPEPSPAPRLRLLGRRAG